MATSPLPNSRASLLSGLRTGGVRSASISDAPHTATTGGAFHILPYARSYLDDEPENIAMPHTNLSLASDLQRQIPMTAAVDGPAFAMQQSNPARGLNPHSVSFNATYNLGVPSSQALQMQALQLEIIRLQTLQAQQYQAELVAQAQRQQAQSRLANLNPPVSAGPHTIGFDLRSATLRRANQAEQLKTQLGINDDHVTTPGNFANRILSGSGNGIAIKSRQDDHGDDGVVPSNPLVTAGQTTVISGGTSLGTSASNYVNHSNGGTSTPPSKSDAAVSWRRGGNTSVLNGNRGVVVNTSPSVKITPPPGESVSPPASVTTMKTRPLPLRFSVAASQPLVAVTAEAVESVEATDDNGDNTSSTESSKSSESISSPVTPPSSSSSNDVPLSPREEASKKLYAGLGIGKSGPMTTPTIGPSVVSHRMASQPLRQPRGPPSGADELGPKNFATRIRRKAIGGLGVLMGARERREVVEAF